MHSFNHTQLKKLLDFILVEPSPQDSDKRAFKYPFLAADILSSEAKEITETFFKTEKELTAPESISSPDSSPKNYPLLERLLSFLSPNTELNPVLLGYFCRTFSSLVDSHKETLWRYLAAHREHIDRLLDFANVEPVAELVAKLFGAYGICVGEELKEAMCEVVKKMVESPDKGWNVISSIISFENYHEWAIDKKVVEKVLSTVASKPENLEKGLKIVTSLADSIVASRNVMSPFELPKNADKSKRQIVSDIIDLTTTHLFFLKFELRREDLLLSGKLAVIKFLSSIIQMKDNPIGYTLIEYDFIPALIDLFAKYPNCTILHVRVHNILKELLASKRMFALENSLLKPVPEKLIALFNDAKSGFAFDETKAFNKPYTVFVTQLCWTIKELAKDSERIESMLQGVEGWKELVEGKLEEIHKRENTKIGEDVKQRVGRGFLFKELLEESAKLEEEKDDEGMFAKEEYQEEIKGGEAEEKAEDKPPKEGSARLKKDGFNELQKKLKFEVDSEEANPIVYIQQVESDDADV